MSASRQPSDILALTFAEHLIIWAMRAIASGRRDCALVRGAFAEACAPVGDEAFNAYEVFVRELARQGRRQIRLAAPGCFCVTHDELALVALFAAAQEGAHERLDAHLTWLLGARPERPLAAAASLVAQALDFNGHLIRPPGQTGERPALQGDLSNELQPIALIRDADPTQPGLTRWS